jgi:hypothetical protein
MTLMKLNSIWWRNDQFSLYNLINVDNYCTNDLRAIRLIALTINEVQEFPDVSQLEVDWLLSCKMLLLKFNTHHAPLSLSLRLDACLFQERKRWSTHPKMRPKAKQRSVHPRTEHPTCLLLCFRSLWTQQQTNQLRPDRLLTPLVRWMPIPETPALTSSTPELKDGSAGQNLHGFSTFDWLSFFAIETVGVEYPPWKARRRRTSNSFRLRRNCGVDCWPGGLDMSSWLDNQPKRSVHPSLQHTTCYFNSFSSDTTYGIFAMQRTLQPSGTSTTLSTGSWLLSCVLCGKPFNAMTPSQRLWHPHTNRSSKVKDCRNQESSIEPDEWWLCCRGCWELNN